MSAESPPNPPKTRSFAFSIGQLTFGSFLLVLAVIIITGAASVIAIRHIDQTFGELQRLQSVGDLAEDIDRRMNELRLAARDFVTDPGTQSMQVAEAVTALSEVLKKTRLELAPEQQDMIDGVTERLSTYRSGIERISSLINRRADLIVGLPPLREKFDAAISDSPDPVLTSSLFQSQSRIATALLAHNPSAAEVSAQDMRALPISEPKLREAVDGYADAIIAIAIRERQIADIDKEVLGTEGRLIQRVTELLRQAGAQRGHILSRDFARTLAEAKWQSIVLGTAGVIIGLFAALLVVRRTVRPLAAIAVSIRAVAGGEKNASIPAIDVDNEIGDIARAAEVFRQTLVDADAAREAAVHALAEQRLAEESYRKLFETSVDGIYVTTPGGELLNANPALARIMGYATPQELINSIGDVARSVYLHAAAREQYQFLMRRDGIVREFEYQVRARDGTILWLSDSASSVRNEAGEIVRYEGVVRDITDQKRAEDAIAEGRRFRHRAKGCDRPHHHRPDVALRRAKDRRKRQKGFGGGQGARLLRGGIPGFRRQHAAMAGEQAAAAQRRRRDRKHRHRRARYRRAQARRTRDAQGQGGRRSRLAQSARDPEFADRGGKARRAGPAGGGHCARGQQSRRH